MTHGKAVSIAKTVCPRVDAGVKELNEMTIGRTDDPENPLKPRLSKSLDCLGPDRGLHLGQRS
jgi:hypothetical protein